MSTESAPAWRGWAIFGLTVLATAGATLLLASILERRAEALAPDSGPKQPIAKFEPDSAKWGVNYPREFDSYKKTKDSTSVTKYGGSAARDLLAEDPASAVLFAGFAFGKDYNQARGHEHTVEDILASKRYSPEKTPGSCWTCKSPDVPRMMEKLGGPEKFYAMKAEALKPEVTHALGCADCHDEKTMALTITRPALKEAFQRQGKDISTASHQEMRSLVCAQCHVTYYFKKEPANYVTFPWDKGTSIEQIEEYYKDTGFADFTHAISGTPIAKTRHPDYEIYQKGIHAYRNVSCADCHMPYKTEGGAKFTDHHIQSPLNNIANSCAVCHRWGESEIRARVESIQDKIHEGRQHTGAALVKAHFDVAACVQVGAKDDELKPLRDLVRSAQLKWDFVASNNGMGFHAPQECQRILALANDTAQEARLAAAKVLAAHGYTAEVVYPDTSTKEKAQAVSKAFIDKNPPKLLK